MSRRTRKLFNFGYYLTVVLLIVNGVVTVVNLRRVVEGDRWVDHTRLVVIELERWLSTLKDAETGQRGYLLTGDPEYLGPFHLATERLDGMLDRLGALTSDQPAQQGRVAELRRLQDARLGLLTEAIARMDREGPDSAIALVRTHRGKRIMDEARRVAVELAEFEDGLLGERVGRSLSATRVTYLTFTLATVAALLLLSWVYFLKRSEDAEQQQSAERVRRSEERLRLIVESAESYAILTTDTQGRITGWNSGARTIIGHDADEILGRSIETLYLPEDVRRDVPGQEVARALDLGRAENERWHVRKDGSRFWGSGLLMPMRDGDRVVGFLKILRDTTEQKRTELELELSRERLDLVVNSSEVGLWYCDLPFDTLIWNTKCKAHFGLPPDAEVGIGTFYERLHPDDRERARRAIESAIEGRNDYDIEFRTVAPDGRVRWVRAIGRAFYGVDGEPIRFDGITVDVTERIRQEEALRESDRRKDEFLATLAHELRNPLAPIRNVLHLMAREGGLPVSFEEERAMAERQVAHLARLVEDLMDVARINRGKIELRREPLDLSAVVARAVAATRPAIAERGHALEVSAPPGPLRLEGDATRLEQVLGNLLTNAAKYTEPGGRIRLEVAREESEAVVRVVDTGIGIAPEMLPRVFEMFVQAEEGLARAQGGLGIGLGLVRSLVELHGGTIEAESEGPGRGSTFVVRLPLLPDAAEGPDRAEPDETIPAPPRRRVLIVDDNRDAAESLARVLGRLYGQEVRVAHDGPSALELAESARPDVVLLDIGMPGMDGHEVARRLRARHEFARTLLVALTGWGQDADRRRSAEAGFDHHLVKPVDPAELAGLLARDPEASDLRRDDPAR